MTLQQEPLRQFFLELVTECYRSGMGMPDDEIANYVTGLLTEFSRSDHLYSMRNAAGDPLREISAMAAAADPVHGAASSFGEEREFRKHIGDYALFFTGMYPDSARSSRRQGGNTLNELVETGKESYYIVSQFDLFEYAGEAPFFARMAQHFEDCMHGLNLVRERLDLFRANRAWEQHNEKSDA